MWPLPLLIAVLFVIAAHVAYALSIQGGHVPACVPYVDGCVSISRAARHGVGNHLFRLLVIPCAVLHALVWLLASGWLRGRRVLVALGIPSAIALALYASFLGTDGEAYRVLRRYGVVVYFGLGFVAQLVLMRHARRQQALSARTLSVMSWLCVGMLLLGLGNALAVALTQDAARQDRWENIFEWWLGLLMVGWYLALAGAWRTQGLRIWLDDTRRVPPG